MILPLSSINCKLSFDPFPNHQSPINSLKFSFTMFFTFFPLTFIDISTVIPKCSISMKLISAKHSLINIFIRKFEYPYSMFHPAAPITLILCTRNKKIMPIAMYLIQYETAIIFFSVTEQISPPAIFG